MIVERLVEKLSIRSSFLKLILGSTLIALIIALGMTGKDLRSQVEGWRGKSVSSPRLIKRSIRIRSALLIPKIMFFP